MNPFTAEPEYIDIVDSPDRRVQLECRCGEVVSQGKYWRELKLLSFKCSKGHITKVSMDLDE